MQLVSKLSHSGKYKFLYSHTNLSSNANVVIISNVTPTITGAVQSAFNISMKSFNVIKNKQTKTLSFLGLCYQDCYDDCPS